MKAPRSYFNSIVQFKYVSLNDTAVCYIAASYCNNSSNLLIKQYNTSRFISCRLFQGFSDLFFFIFDIFLLPNLRLLIYGNGMTTLEPERIKMPKIVKTPCRTFKDAGDYISVEECALIIGVSRSTVIRNMNAGKLRSIKFGYVRRIETASARELIATLQAAA